MAFRYYPPVYMLIFLVLQILLNFLFPIYTVLEFPQSLIGIAFILFGFFLAGSVNSAIVREGTTIVSDGKPTALITSGVFRFSRNPMYLGSVILLIGTGMVLGSAVTSLSVFGMFLVLDRKFIPVEEQILTEIFGDEYTTYTKKVRRWI